jgi:hypothetical protein
MTVPVSTPSGPHPTATSPSPHPLPSKPAFDYESSELPQEDGPQSHPRHWIPYSDSVNFLIILLRLLVPSRFETLLFERQFTPGGDIVPFLQESLNRIRAFSGGYRWFPAPLVNRAHDGKWRAHWGTMADEFAAVESLVPGQVYEEGSIRLFRLIVDGLIGHLDFHVISAPEQSTTPFHDLFKVTLRTAQLCQCEERPEALSPPIETDMHYALIRSSDAFLNYSAILKEPIYDSTSDLCPNHGSSPTQDTLVREYSFDFKGDVLLLVFDKCPSLEKTDISYNPPVSSRRKWFQGEALVFPRPHRLEVVYRERRKRPIRDAITGKGIDPSPAPAQTTDPHPVVRPLIAVYTARDTVESNNQAVPHDTSQQGEHRYATSSAGELTPRPTNTDSTYPRAQSGQHDDPRFPARPFRCRSVIPKRPRAEHRQPRCATTSSSRYYCQPRGRTPSRPHHLIGTNGSPCW